MSKDNGKLKAKDNGANAGAREKNARPGDNGAFDPRTAHASTSSAVKPGSWREHHPSEQFTNDLEAVRKSRKQLAIHHRRVVLDVVALTEAVLRTNKRKSVKPFVPDDPFVRKRFCEVLSSGMVCMSLMDNHEAVLNQFRRHFAPASPEGQDSTFSPNAG